jgi:hypothetical protein
VQDILGSINVTLKGDADELPLPHDIATRLGLASWSARLSEDLRMADFAKKIENGEAFVDLAPNIVQSPMGYQPIVERFPGGWTLAPIETYFAASNELTALVRYRPTRWACSAL